MDPSNAGKDNRYLEGVLYKWTNVMKGWQPRYFVLDVQAATLSYYSSQEEIDVGCKGSYRVTAACQVHVDPNESTAVELRFPPLQHQPLYLKASTAQERARWIGKIIELKSRDANTSTTDIAATSLAHLSLTTLPSRCPTFVPRDYAENTNNAHAVHNLPVRVVSLSHAEVDDLRTKQKEARFYRQQLKLLLDSLRAVPTVTSNAGSQQSAAEIDRIWQEIEPISDVLLSTVTECLDVLEEKLGNNEKLLSTAASTVVTTIVSPFSNTVTNSRRNPGGGDNINKPVLLPAVQLVVPSLAGHHNRMQLNYITTEVVGAQSGPLSTSATNIKSNNNKHPVPSDITLSSDEEFVDADSASTYDGGSGSSPAGKSHRSASTAAAASPEKTASHQHYIESSGISSEAIVVVNGLSSQITGDEHLPNKTSMAQHSAATAETAHKQRLQTIFSNTNTTFHDALADDGEGVLTDAFLKSCTPILSMLDILGKRALYPVKKDLQGNINRLRKHHDDNISSSKTLQAIVECDNGPFMLRVSKSSDNNKVIKPQGSAEALLWLKRGLQFLERFLHEIIILSAAAGNNNNKSEDLSKCAQAAYDVTLRQHHNALARGVFHIALKAMPSKSDFLHAAVVVQDPKNNKPGLGKDEALVQQVVLRDVRQFRLGLYKALARLQRYYEARGFEEKSLYMIDAADDDAEIAAV